MYIRETNNGLEVIPKPMWYGDDGALVTDNMVFANEGIYQIYDVPPDHDERLEIATRNPPEEWTKEGHFYVATYTVKRKEDKDILEKETRNALNKIARETDWVIGQGMEYDFDGVVDRVQIRMKDKVNLLGLRLEAQDRIDSNDEKPFIFKAKSNVEYAVKPVVMKDMTKKAIEHIESIIIQNWEAKKRVDGVVTEFNEDRVSIEEAVEQLRSL